MESSCTHHVSTQTPGKKFLQSLNSVSPLPVKHSAAADQTSKQQTAPASSHKHNRWHILKQRHPRVGVVPVDENHVHHKLLSYIRHGLQQVMLNKPDIAAKERLTVDDFSDISRSRFNFAGQDFEFESYAGSVFATIRQAIGLDEQNYFDTVAQSCQPYLEFRSNSKSGQDFFLSHDMQYILKSNRKRDVKFFLSVLPKYLQHFICYPHSLLVKCVGCYTIKLKGKPKKYFLAMQSIFYPADRIESRFDIKGCTAGRYQQPMDPDLQVITVLKDQNFLKEQLHFGDQAVWFLKQLAQDSLFLCQLNCMDYSLLVGRQRKHVDETTTETIFSIVNRAGKSISPTKTRNASWHVSHDHSHMPGQETGDQSNICTSLQDKQTTAPRFCNHDPETVTSPRSVIIPTVKPGVMFPRSLADGVDKFQQEHRRLLPNCVNQLHIIDGPDCRYFVGIVDFLTRFDWRQKTAQYWKILKYCCGDHSTKQPDVYQQRFVSFLTDRVRF